ncbi:invasion associated locus B family protein [Henriciella marina]|uniref:invasion associated locus B family protein n=1 Tax=Henriciella marina TaxID=453851 RepID=UPI00035C717C|nr:invasion associated locus B family protein [Henriciella marina]
MIRLAATAAITGALLIPLAQAAPTAIGRYDDWTVFTENVGGETLCYAATEATDKAPQAANHGDVWFFVSNWKSGQARSQPSLKVGYELRADLPGRATVGRSGWTMYGVGREAFAQDRDDTQIVDALRRGTELHVEAVSSRNTQVSYHFSLSGSADAIEKASSLCR